MVTVPLVLNSWIEPVYALGIGVFLGGISQYLLQFPLLIKEGMRPKVPKKIFSPLGKKVFRLLGPGLVGFAAAQINMLVTTILASGTVVGAVSWLSYAFRLFQFPVGILGVSIAGSNLVHFSDSWKKGESEKAISFLKESLTLSYFTIIPVFFSMLLLKQEAVEIVFQRGQFSNFDSNMTSLALGFYLLGLPFYSVNKIAVPVFYSLEKQKIPVIVSLISISLNIAFCLALTEKYGFKILALGPSLTMLLNAMAFSFFLRKLLRLHYSFFIDWKLAKILLASSISFLLLTLFKLKVTSFGAGLFVSLIYFFSVFGLFSFLYLTLLYFLGERLFHSSLKKGVNKLFS